MRKRLLTKLRVHHGLLVANMVEGPVITHFYKVCHDRGHTSLHTANPARQCPRSRVIKYNTDTFYTGILRSAAAVARARA